MTISVLDANSAPQTISTIGDLLAAIAPVGTLLTTRNTLSTSAEVIIAENTSRKFAEVKNNDTAISIYIGMDNTVSASNGHLLDPGDAFGFEKYSGPIWAVAASGAPVVTTIEW